MLRPSAAGICGSIWSSHSCVCLCLQTGPGSTSGVCSEGCKLQQNPLGWDAPGPDPTPCSSVQFVIFGVSSLCKGCSCEQERECSGLFIPGVFGDSVSQFLAVFLLCHPLYGACPLPLRGQGS